MMIFPCRTPISYYKRIDLWLTGGPEMRPLERYCRSQPKSCERAEWETRLRKPSLHRWKNVRQSEYSSTFWTPPCMLDSRNPNISLMLWRNGQYAIQYIPWLQCWSTWLFLDGGKEMKQDMIWWKWKEQHCCQKALMIWLASCIDPKHKRLDRRTKYYWVSFKQLLGIRYTSFVSLISPYLSYFKFSRLDLRKIFSEWFHYQYEIAKFFPHNQKDIKYRSLLCNPARVIDWK